MPLDAELKLRISKKMKRELEALAKEENRKTGGETKVSDLIRKAIYLYLKIGSGDALVVEKKDTL